MLPHRTQDMSINSSNYICSIPTDRGKHSHLRCGTGKLCDCHAATAWQSKNLCSVKTAAGDLLSAMLLLKNWTTNFPSLPVPISHSPFLKNQRQVVNFLIFCVVFLFNTFQQLLFYTSNLRVMYFRRKSEQRPLGYVPAFLIRCLLCHGNDYLSLKRSMEVLNILLRHPLYSLCSVTNKNNHTACGCLNR